MRAPEPSYVAAVLAIAATITLALRALPFVVVGRLAGSPVAAELRDRMPAGLMVILAVYLLRDLPVGDLGGLLPAVAALAVTVGLYAWRGDGVLGVLGGAALYVALVGAVPGLHA